ncbi:uncharacterized protein At3g60930, chloroplastic-like [Capsella rubella]|uniref:uncharacterized protein At3g60930, chloroplastic-like n=1 Tax=Capsella rubella TaxID=81985 RepID=UPI000CD58C89|nr:uncharacterized protein At3g60930, chloroplastic-like [Capsella rubella]
MSPPKQTLPTGDASLSGQFGPHPRSTIKEEDLVHIKFLCGLSSEADLIAPGPDLSPEDPPPGYCCAYEIFFSRCGLYFPLPELLVKAMFALGITLPQLCPNFVRTILCLQTLAEEHGYLLTFQDILHLYTIKSGRTRGTFYLSPLAGFRVFDDFPEKDEQYRSDYFFFLVNRDTFGDLQELLVPHWSQKPASLDRGLLSQTFADYFTTFCGAETAWDSFTCPRIREAGARIRTRFLTVSSPQSAPPNMNYREERAHKKKMELKEKELKKKMVAALADAKVKNSSKEKSSSSVAPPEGGDREVITLPDSDVSTESPAARPTPGDGQASEPKKRKAAEPARPVRASSRLRTEEKPAETPASKGSLPATPSPVDPKATPMRELPGKLPVTRLFAFSLSKPLRSNTNALFAAPPKSLADMMRSFSRPGARVPAFKDMSTNNREDYFRFAEKVGEMLFEFNSSVAHYEEQLFVTPSASEIGVLQSRISDLEKEVKKLRSSEASNRAEVEKAVKFNKRLRTVEGDLQIAESSLETCQDKLILAGELYLKATTAETEARQELQEVKLRNQLLEAGNSSEMERVRREERRKTRAELRSTIDQIGEHLVEHDRMIPHAIRAAEITANRMLVEEIERGEIADLKEELETLKADELAANLEAEKVKNLSFDPSSFTALLADSPPELGPDPAPTTLMIEEPATDPPAVPNQELEAIKPGLSKEVREMSTPESGGAPVGETAGLSSARFGDHTADPELN